MSREERYARELSVLARIAEERQQDLSTPLAFQDKREYFTTSLLQNSEDHLRRTALLEGQARLQAELQSANSASSWLETNTVGYYLQAAQIARARDPTEWEYHRQRSYTKRVTNNWERIVRAWIDQVLPDIFHCRFQLVISAFRDYSSKRRPTPIGARAATKAESYETFHARRVRFRQLV